MNTPDATPAPDSTMPTVPAGNYTQQGGQPGDGLPPSGGNDPDADAGLLFNAGQQQPEGGQTEGQGSEPGKEGEGEKKPEGAPEKYELNMKEGFAWDEATAAAVTPMFQELGLSNEQAQKLADFHMDAMQKFQSSQIEKFHAIQAAELEAAKTDPEVGGAKLQESLGFAAKAMDAYGGQEFRQALATHGMANNVTMLKFLAKVGRELTGDHFVKGTPAPKEESAAKVLYPNWN